MIALVTGGAASGKSAFAERLALSLPGPHWYVATMRRGGEEAEARVVRHVAARAGKGFVTVELVQQPGAKFGQRGTVLVEDLANLLLNGLEGELERVLACENAVVVTNEIGCDGSLYDRFTQNFIERLGALSCEVAARADLVVEVVAGIPQVVKGDARAIVTLSEKEVK